MRAKDAVKLGTVDYTLAYPQDGQDQPATYLSVAANRSSALTLTALQRPIKGNPLASVGTLQLIQPLVRAVDSVDTVVALNRASIEVRLSDKSTEDEINAFLTQISAALASADINVVLKGQRLV